jgi:hypothetical protein
LDSLLIENLKIIKKKIFNYEFTDALNIFKENLLDNEINLLNYINKEVLEIINISIENKDYLLFSDLIENELIPALQDLKENAKVEFN